MIISEAFERYCLEEIKLRGGAPKTIRNYSSTLSTFVRMCGDMPVELITPDHALRWHMCMEAEGIQSSTVSSYLSKLRQVLKYLKRRGVNVVDHQQIKLPRVSVKERDFVTSIEAQQMIAHATRLRDKALIATLWSSGSRIAEVLSLNRESIQNGKAHVIGKNSRQVTVRIDSTAQKCIDEYLASRRDKLPALFISAQMRRLTVQRAEQIVNEIAGELGITRPDGSEKRITPHTFRHGYATDLLTNGADLATAQQLLGHANLSTTRIYAHITQPREDENYARFHSG
jgi:integrase/recombinase XerD